LHSNSVHFVYLIRVTNNKPQLALYLLCHDSSTTLAIQDSSLCLPFSYY
jgi:hypothetical protein